MALQTRKPTGLPSWPILLLTGGEKTGKTYAAAAASASDLIGRTLWISIGEDDPDEYGAIPGARFEIVAHDGTYRGILGALDECVREMAGDKLPGLIVLDSVTRLWQLLSDEAQARANRRAAEKAKKYNRPATLEDATIGMDLWNLAKQRWDHVMDCLRDHKGPSIVTARLDLTAVVDDRGEPTKDKARKVQAHKSLPFDVGAIVDFEAPGSATLTGVRSLRLKDSPVTRRAFPDFTVDRLWRELGLAEQASERTHTVATGEGSITADDHADAERTRLLEEIATLADSLGIPRLRIGNEWAEQHPDDRDISATRDLGSLELLRDDLTAKASEKEKSA